MSPVIQQPIRLSARSPRRWGAHFICTLPDTVTCTVLLPASTGTGASAMSLLASMAMARGRGEPAGFVAVLTQAMAAMGPLAGQATLRDLHFDGAQVAMTVQATDLGTLQAVETALSAASLGVMAGTATTADGLAEQQLTVTR